MLRTGWISLQNKLTLSLAVLVMAIVACSAYFAIQRERGRSLSELEVRATRLAELLSSSLAEPLWNVDVKAINDQLGALAVDSEVAEVAVMALNFGSLQAVGVGEPGPPVFRVMFAARERQIGFAAGGRAQRHGALVADEFAAHVVAVARVVVHLG